MQGERSIVTLGELYDFSSGLSKPRSAFGSGYPFLTFKDVFHNIFVPDELGDLVNSTERDQQSCSVKRGDVFLTRTSETMDELGMSCVALCDVDGATFNGFTKRLRPKFGVDIVPEFVGYFFRSDWFRRQVTAMASLSTRASLNNEMLGRLRMILPGVLEQQSIGSMLKSLDDKIDLNRRMNETLEAMARAIFKSWFVDFDPVRAKMAGEQPAGLAPEITALFPDALVESELGEVPKGWHEHSLADLFPKDRECVLTGPFGSNLHAHDYRDEGIPLILVKHVNNGQILDDGLPLVGIHKLSELERYRLVTADIVFTRVGAVGRSAYVHPHQEGWLISGQTLRVRVPNKTILNPRYLAQVYLEQTFINMVQSHALGTTRPSLNTSLLEAFRFLLPPVEIQDVFERIVASFDHRAQSNLFESRRLATIRDTLLPKLISGELRVADAERIVGRSL